MGRYKLFIIFSPLLLPLLVVIRVNFFSGMSSSVGIRNRYGQGWVISSIFWIQVQICICSTFSNPNTKGLKQIAIDWYKHAPSFYHWSLVLLCFVLRRIKEIGQLHSLTLYTGTILFYLHGGYQLHIARLITLRSFYIK